MTDLDKQAELMAAAAAAKRAAERKALIEGVRKRLLDALRQKYPNRMDAGRLGGVNGNANS